MVSPFRAGCTTETAETISPFVIVVYCPCFCHSNNFHNPPRYGRQKYNEWQYKVLLFFIFSSFSFFPGDLPVKKSTLVVKYPSMPSFAEHTLNGSSSSTATLNKAALEGRICYYMDNYLCNENRTLL